MLINFGLNMIKLPLGIYQHITFSDKRTGWLNHAQFPAGSCFPSRPNRLWNLPSRLSSEYRGRLPRR